jgi:hypothetical protein
MSNLGGEVAIVIQTLSGIGMLDVVEKVALVDPTDR